MTDPVLKADAIVAKTLNNLAASPNINLSEADAADIKPAVVDEISKVIVNQTNQEPWYQSRVTWGAILAAGAGLAGMLGYTFSAEDQRFWLDNIEQGIQLGGSVVALAGGALAWYGRWKAKKPIGA